MAGFFSTLYFKSPAMKNAKKTSSTGERIADTILTKRRLTAEIRRIGHLKAPLTEKMRDTRYLIEQYFRMAGNEDMLNANL